MNDKPDDAINNLKYVVSMLKSNWDKMNPTSKMFITSKSRQLVKWVERYIK